MRILLIAPVFSAFSAHGLWIHTVARLGLLITSRASFLSLSWTVLHLPRGMLTLSQPHLLSDTW